MEKILPSPIIHTAAGYLIYSLFRHRLILNQDRRINRSIFMLLIVVLISLAPDFDAIPGIIIRDFGQYHNQITHSFFFGLFVALLVSAFIWWWKKTNFLLWFFILWGAYSLHLILDYFTYGGRGMMLLWPISAARFRSNVSLFYGVHWSKGWLTVDHLITLITELVLLLIIAVAIQFIRGWKTRRTASPS